MRIGMGSLYNLHRERVGGKEQDDIAPFLLGILFQRLSNIMRDSLEYQPFFTVA